jgi:hypothetical protein
LALEYLEDRLAPATVTILGSGLVSSGGSQEQFAIYGFLAIGYGDRTVNLDPGTYSVQNAAGTFGTFTVSSQDSVAGTTGALVATANTITFDLTQLAAITINDDLVTSTGIHELVSEDGFGAYLHSEDTVYIPTGTYTLGNNGGGTYGTFTVADNGPESFVVAGTTGALVASGNTINFDLSQMAAITINNDLVTSSGFQELVSESGPGGYVLGSHNPDTIYYPPGTYSLSNLENGVYGTFTVADNGAGSFGISAATGALVATGNTINIDATKLAAITINNNLITAGGSQEQVQEAGVGADVQYAHNPDTLYLPPATYYLNNLAGTYGTFTVADNGSGAYSISGTTGAAVATGNTISFEECALNSVTITPNPGVAWYLDSVTGSNPAADTVFLPDGSYTLHFSGAGGGAGPATFTVGANGLSATELPASAPLVSLKLTPCAPTLVSAAHVANGTTISGAYMGRANTTYQLDFYADTTATSAGLGQGKTLLGSMSVTTDSSGNATFTASVAAPPAGETLLSATATDPNGNTSDFSQVICLPPSALGKVYTVYTTADSGPGSLRQVIQDADANATGTAVAPDEITFCIPVTDPGYNSSTDAFTIQPLSALPTITDTLILDGYTEPGASPNTLTIGDNAVLNIVLDGSKAGVVDGLVVAGGTSTVRGLVIDNFAYGSGLVLNGTGNDVVVGNFIGIDVTGESAAANNIGVNANSSGDRIGGTTPGDRNIVSGNNSGLPDSADGGGNPAGFGIVVDNGDLIQGNYTGTDKSGTYAMPNGAGIVAGSNNTIGGLTATLGAGAGNLISGNTGNLNFGKIGWGIEIGNQNVIAGNLIGTTAAGLTALGNGAGIYIISNNNTIGGTTSGARNIISANDANRHGASGIDIEGGQYNLVEGNYIGTDIDGTTGLGIQRGIVLGFGSYNTIGGTTVGARNVISGSYGDEILIGGPYATYAFSNAVLGNYIGTDASGTVALGNVYGIHLLGPAHDNIIGGTGPGAGNVIAGNGIGIFLNGGRNNLVQGNVIGTDKTGTVALGNSATGIEIEASNNTIGGTNSGAGNTIAFNSGHGVDVDSGTGNSILSNSIFANGSPAILLNSANNANNNQAAPLLTSGSASSTGTSISGTLTSVANTTFRIEFFANQGLDPAGNAEGQTFLGFVTVTTNSSGNATFPPPAVNLAPIPAGEGCVTATATNETTGDTSQFSNYLAVPTSMQLTASASPSLFGQPVTLTATVTANFAGFGTPTGSVIFMDTTTNTNLGSATLSGGIATLTTAALNTGTHVITATYAGNIVFLGSSATLTETIAPSILVLNPTANAALTLSGNAAINVPGNVVVDSSSKTALTENGNASITAASIQVVGTVSLSGNATLSPAALTGAASVADPLAGLTGPSTTGLTNYGSVNLSGQNTAILCPGIYSQISASGNASLTLNPGVYIIEGGGFTVTGNASVTATCVTIYNTGSNYPNAGGSYGGIRLSGNGSFSLTAAASGPYAGVLIFQSRANTRALSFSGNGVTGITGTIYASSAQVLVSGNAKLTGSLVANELALSGNGVSTQAADGAGGSPIDTASAGTLLAGNLCVYVSDPSDLFTANEQARILDAINAWNTLLVPFSVTISEVADPTLANVVIDTGTTSAAGSAADGVLGSYCSTGEITILQGWNWYDGADPTQIGASQYDFQTVVTHELGHALGLGGSADPTSPMYEILATGVVRRTPGVADLNIPEPPEGADPERAAFPSVGQSFTATITGPATDPSPQAVSGASFSLTVANASVGQAPANAVDSLAMARPASELVGFASPLKRKERFFGGQSLAERPSAGQSVSVARTLPVRDHLFASFGQSLRGDVLAPTGTHERGVSPDSTASPTLALSQSARDTLLTDLASVTGITLAARPAAEWESGSGLTNCLALANAPASDLAALWILTGLLASKHEPIPEARSRRCVSLAR